MITFHRFSFKRWKRTQDERVYWYEDWKQNFGRFWAMNVCTSSETLAILSSAKITCLEVRYFIIFMCYVYVIPSKLSLADQKKHIICEHKSPGCLKMDLMRYWLITFFLIHSSRIFLNFWMLILMRRSGWMQHLEHRTMPLSRRM